jgi:hypothetical protein
LPLQWEVLVDRIRLSRALLTGNRKGPTAHQKTATDMDMQSVKNGPGIDNKGLLLRNEKEEIGNKK